MDACLNTVVRISTEINLLLQSAEGVPGEVSFAAPFHTTYSFVRIAGCVLIYGIPKRTKFHLCKNMIHCLNSMLIHFASPNLDSNTPWYIPVSQHCSITMLMKALKCKTLGVYIVYTMYS